MRDNHIAGLDLFAVGIRAFDLMVVVVNPFPDFIYVGFNPNENKKAQTLNQCKSNSHQS